jgi:hypothetical protein
LPAGTVLHVEIVYDNSADNPENPHHPPQVIRWGRGSNDEMGSITLMTIANQRKDELVLQNEIRKHFVAALVDRKGPILARMLLQLDDDGDGILQRSEAPPRINARIFGLADTDKSGGLDLAEIERLMKLRDQVRGGGNP